MAGARYVISRYHGNVMDLMNIGSVARHMEPGIRHT
jgi:hypothetical protein